MSQEYFSGHFMITDITGEDWYVIVMPGAVVPFTTPIHVYEHKYARKVLRQKKILKLY